jgi:alpha-galactosidase
MNVQMMTTAWHSAFLFLTIATVQASAVTRAAAALTVQPPPNAPATVEWNAGPRRLSLRYHGAVILDATVGAADTAGRPVAGVEIKFEPTETLSEKVEQRLKLVPARPQESVKLVLRGTATGSEEALPVETSGVAQKRFPLVRNSVGLSHNLRNNAIYDRRWDWVTGPGRRGRSS